MRQQLRKRLALVFFQTISVEADDDASSGS